MPNSKRRIMRVDDLPKTFCLEKYAATKLLEATGWARMLSDRNRLQSYDIKPDPDSGAIKDQFIHDVFNDPLYQRTTFPFPISETDLSEQALKKMTVNDLYSLSTRLSNPVFSEEATEARKHFNDHSTVGKAHLNPLSKSAQEFCNKAIDSLDVFPARPGCYDNEILHLSVNMMCTNEQLFDQFKKVLQDARNSENINPRKTPFTIFSFEKWHKLAILPYLDLSLWAQANGVLIDPQVYSKAIYPEFDKEYSQTRTINEKVAPLALTLMRRETLKTLITQS